MDGAEKKIDNKHNCHECQQKDKDNGAFLHRRKCYDATRNNNIDAKLVKKEGMTKL